ncbi:unnamed protein product [Symbiodinium necroappetens]|uniref:Uncharacterized protein n=1 Tax=Symbiodinium necroappetens TaxID=1628268 RepID=A0A813A6T5_9DINO|nr:unnamed protein product [Symbiodinium necroappetens]
MASTNHAPPWVSHHAGRFEPSQGDVVRDYGRVQNQTHKLFGDIEEYLKHLPTRDVGGRVLKLYELPFCCRSRQLQSLCNDLVQASHSKRSPVKFIVAPTHSGKTACILPAFLQMRRDRTMTHYIYLAFHNNGSNHHEPPVIPDRMFKKMSESAIEEIGFAYLIHCLKRTLCSGYARQNDRFNAQVARNIQLLYGRRGLSYETKLNDEYAELIQGILGDGGVKLLLHVDEHGRMEKNPFFRRGALVRAAGNERVAVIATFTEKPPALSVSNVNSESSECCGVPCTLPRPDMEMLTSEEFQGYPNKQPNPLLVPRDILESQDTEVYLASLRISLGIALEGDGSPPRSVALFGVVGVSLGNLHFQNEAAVFFKTLRHLLTETNRAARYRVPLSMSNFKVDDDQRGQRLHNLSLFMKERVVPRQECLEIVSLSVGCAGVGRVAHVLFEKPYDSLSCVLE